MTAMLAMIAIKFGVGHAAVMVVKRMTKFRLMTDFIAVRNAVQDGMSRALKAHKEQGKDDDVADERSHNDEL